MQTRALQPLPYVAILQLLVCKCEWPYAVFPLDTRFEALVVSDLSACTPACKPAHTILVHTILATTLASLTAVRYVVAVDAVIVGLTTPPSAASIKYLVRLVVAVSADSHVADTHVELYWPGKLTFRATRLWTWVVECSVFLDPYVWKEIVLH